MPSFSHSVDIAKPPEDVFPWLLEQDTTARRFLESAGWAADGTRRSLDMGVPVPTIRLHTTLAA